jgi:hypothetical protein
MINYSFLIIFLLTLGAQFRLRPFIVGQKQGDELIDRPGEEAQNVLLLRRAKALKIFRLIFIVSIAVVLFLIAYKIFILYQLWLKNDFYRHLLPPESLYFYSFSWHNFIKPFFISLLIAFVFILISKFFNRKYNERFFDNEEYYVGALALFLTSYPGCFFYIFFLLIFYLIAHLVFFFFLRQKQAIRLSLYYFWIPVAIFVIIIKDWLSQTEIWRSLIF